MNGPGLFTGIGGKAKDLLTKGYTSDQKLTFTTTSASGVVINTTAVKKGGLYSFDVGPVYKYKNTVFDVKIDADSNASTTVTISDILPSTKAIVSAKLPDYNSGKLEVQYFHHHATLASVVALKQNPVVELSGTIGANGIAFGAEAGFHTASGAFTKYSAGIGVIKPDYIFSVILADKGDTLKASCVKHLDEKQKSSVVGEVVRKFSTNENTVTVGGQYAVDPETTVKARFNNTGKLAALVQHELKPKSFLTISTEVDSKALEKAPKFGLALALQP